MIIETQQYTVIRAESGKFLTNNNGIYGKTVILGSMDSPENYIELPIEQWPEDIPMFIENDYVYSELEEERAKKIREIKAYDESTYVNEFIISPDKHMWLNREDRASLKNTIESYELLGRNTLTIWSENDQLNIPLNLAKLLLATLEVYATDCYNVTSSHISTVKQMNNISDIKNFDITSGYPEKPTFII